MIWKLNTSNKGKLEEFQHLFAKYNIKLKSTHVDLNEIHADPLTVAVHKASQMDEGILVDDTVLEIDGAEVGINIRWFLKHLNNYIGHSASWKVFLAYRKGDNVIVYQGQVDGKIVAASGQGGFGFDPFFLPNGQQQTLAYSKPDEVNARALAVKALILDQKFAIIKAIYEWHGDWQGN